jgi:hypothetical protein
MTSLKQLHETFKEHARQHDELHKKHIASFKEQYPNDPLPDHMQDAFNLAQALALMCENLIALNEGKRWVE